MKEDAELKRLREKKAELIQRVLKLRDELQQQQISVNQQKRSIPEDEILVRLSQNTLQDTLPRNSTDEERFIVRLVDATQQATGIAFQDVDKKWLRENVWLYTCKVVTKVVKFNLELTVDLKDGVDNEIVDITCRFVKVVDCHLQEITPWVAEFARAKKFCYLMSAFSDYNDQCIVRQKILDKLENQKFITIEKCSTGGYTIYIHSPVSSSKKQKSHQQYANFLWKTQFNPKTRTIDHDFTIDALESDFMKQNPELFDDFCKKGLKKEDLEILWAELCTAVDAYKH